MSKLFTIFKWFLTLGSEPQNFLGAGWIQSVLKRVPEGSKRIWALRILALSPHYFIFPDAPEYKGMSNSEYLETVSADVTKSRENISRLLLEPNLDPSSTVLDYGCGPGYLAKAISAHVSEVIGVDISAGAIACAKIVNAADNVRYIEGTPQNLNDISDDSIDAIYAYAVVQHVSKEIFGKILDNCHRMLKPEGKILLHIQLTDEIWKTEEDWKKDGSVAGKVKFNYGLHCFGRTAEEYTKIVKDHGFRSVEINDMVGFDQMFDKELTSQKLLIAYR